MLFNSIEFLIFFLITYSLYLVLPHKWQNRMLLVASYIFYGFWDWRFLFLIFLSTLVDYFCGLRIFSSSSKKDKKKYLIISIFVNLFILGFFKYYGFFVGSLVRLLDCVGLSVHPLTFKIILPVGISFYTFQTMSYTIDIYRKEMEPTEEFFNFALFVAFFPQLVAGPIERAKHLLPQILSKRKLSLSDFYEGCFLIFWGLFEKVFVAGNLAKLVDPVFANHNEYAGAGILFSLYAFSFQIFADFDAYSNIAKGVAKCMGVDLMTNFRLPYFSTTPSEFWERWHISLSRWLRDYLYIPLGGNRKGKLRTLVNLSITMLLGGLWHGAAWHFVAWGAYQGFLLVFYRLGENFKKTVSPAVNPSLWVSLLKGLFFYHCVVIGWLLFRAESSSQAIEMMQAMVFQSFRDGVCWKEFLTLCFFVSPLLLVQILQYWKKDLLVIYHWHWFYKTVFYAFLTYLFFGWGVMQAEEFIYFQF